jgi:hypothetical protein
VSVVNVVSPQAKKPSLRHQLKEERRKRWSSSATSTTTSSVPKRTEKNEIETSQIDSSSDGIVAGPSQPVDIAASQPANANIEESHLANSDEGEDSDDQRMLIDEGRSSSSSSKR